MPLLEKWIGCQIKGSWVKADGSPQRNMTIQIKPEKAGVTSGRIHSADQFSVQTDNKGDFTVALVPGIYQVTFGNDTYVINVPTERNRANFSELIV